MTPEAVRQPDGIAPSGPLGLLGGSFDPVHAGHLQLAADAQQALGLAQVRLIPAAQPWQKPPLTAAQHRLAMLEIAVQERTGTSGWVVDRCEVDRSGPTYTIDTLRQLRANLGPTVSLVWILGSDQLSRLPSWREWESLASLAHIAYAERAGQPAELPEALAEYVAARRTSPDALALRPAGGFAAFPMQAVDCSATQIRGAVAAGAASRIKNYLSPGVLGYIQAHQLYLAVNGQ